MTSSSVDPVGNGVSSATSSSATSSSDERPEAGHSEYEHWVRRLYRTNLFHPVKMGLQNIQQLHEQLGNPMDATTVIHIAGTNGKGSVALKIAKTLEHHNPNLNVGLFISPHVSSFRERMQVNSQLISEAEVVELLPRIYDLCQQHDIPATFFEITTALAFAFYQRRQARVVVLETGLGGRLDATNVVQSPALAVITSIGLEHTRILGDTVEQIALEKGGIIKEGRPVLVGPQVPHHVLRQCAQEKHASHYYTVEDVLGERPADAPGGAVEDDYDVENSRTATAALRLIQESHPELFGSLTEESIRRGTSERPPCRFQTLTFQGHDVILDVAHNPPAMEYMVRKLLSTYPDQPVRIVVGMSSDKDLRLCGSSLLQAVKGDQTRIHLVEAAHPRAASLEAILTATGLTGAHYDLEKRSVTDQIQTALKLARDHKEVLVVCGSVFLMAEAREALGIEEPRDSPYISDVAGAGFRHSQENFGNSNSQVAV